MKKLMIAVVAVGLVAGTFAFAGVTYAQTQTPPATPYSGVGPGRMGGLGGTGLLHDEMVAAVAAKLGVSVDELQAQLNAGQTVWQIAQAQGLTADETTALLQAAHSEALQQAVADGTLTQAQADWMSQRTSQMGTGGLGLGSGACGGLGGGMGSGWRGGAGRGNGRSQ